MSPAAGGIEFTEEHNKCLPLYCGLFYRNAFYLLRNYFYRFAFALSLFFLHSSFALAFEFFLKEFSFEKLYYVCILIASFCISIWKRIHNSFFERIHLNWSYLLNVYIIHLNFRARKSCSKVPAEYILLEHRCAITFIFPHRCSFVLVW